MSSCLLFPGKTSDGQKNNYWGSESLSDSGKNHCKQIRQPQHADWHAPLQCEHLWRQELGNEMKWQTKETSTTTKLLTLQGLVVKTLGIYRGKRIHHRFHWFTTILAVHACRQKCVRAGIRLEMQWQATETGKKGTKANIKYWLSKQWLHLLPVIFLSPVCFGLGYGATPVAENVRECMMVAFACPLVEDALWWFQLWCVCVCMCVWLCVHVCVIVCVCVSVSVCMKSNAPHVSVSNCKRTEPLYLENTGGSRLIRTNKTE